jgi:protein TonB
MILFAAAALARVSADRVVDPSRATQSGNENTGRATERKLKIYTVGQGVSAPTFIPTPDSAAPNSVLKAKRKGTVFLEMVVDEQGKPENLRVTHSCGEDLDKKAVDAVSKWRFQPAMKEGSPVAVKIVVKVDFQLY